MHFGKIHVIFLIWMNIHRVLVIGGSGYLGSAICAGLRDQYEVFGTYKYNEYRMEGVTSFSFDLINGDDVHQVLRRFRPDCVIFAGGVTDREYCEANAAVTEAINYKSIALFFKLAAQPFYFIHFSTEDVFLYDALKGKSQFKEGEQGTPLNSYIKSKIQAENFINSQRKQCANIRLSKVYGEPFGSSTLIRYSSFESLKNRVDQKQRVRFEQSVRRSHIYLGDVIRATRLLLEKPPENTRTYHWTHKQVRLTDAEILRIYADQANIKDSVIESDPEGKQSEISLSEENFKTHYGFEFQSPADGMTEYLERLRTGFTRTWT